MDHEANHSEIGACTKCSILQMSLACWLRKEKMECFGLTIYSCLIASTRIYVSVSRANDRPSAQRSRLLGDSMLCIASLATLEAAVGEPRLNNIVRSFPVLCTNGGLRARAQALSRFSTSCPSLSILCSRSSSLSRTHWRFWSMMWIQLSGSEADAICFSSHESTLAL